MVDVSNKYKNITVAVSSNNGNTVVAASSDTSQYWANQSHTFANQSKESVQEAKEYAELANSYIEGFEDVVTSNTNNIITTSNDCISQITELKNTGVQEIDEAVTSGKDEINSTKTTILNDIEFVADGEKEEIRDIIDTGKDELKEAIGDVKVLTTLKIGQIGIAPLGIDETLNMERYLNGQIIIQDQFKGFTAFLKKRVALYPSIACLEDEWQTEVTMSAFSQCGKFVIDDNAGTIRLPKVVNIQGLTDLSKLAEIVEAGLPNIEGSFTSRGFAYGAGAEVSGSLSANVYGNYGVNASACNGGTGNYQLQLNASRSSSIYGNSTTVQQEQIQYPYFIQVATGAETEDNIINEIELNNPYSFGDSKYSPVVLNNLSWLKSEGQWNSKAVYPAYYNWALINANNGVEGFKFITDEYTDYDVVINTADETFRLPLLDGSEDLPSDKYIDLTYTSSGHTEISPANGWLTFKCNSGTSNAYLTITNNTSRLAVTDHAPATGDVLQCTCIGAKGDEFVIHRNASGSVTAFRFTYAQGNGSLYFYVGETVQNANLINAGRIEEKLVDKVDKNSSWGFPDRFIDLTIGATGTQYTAPANGWYNLRGQVTANYGYIELTAHSCMNVLSQTTASINSSVIMPVKKGQVVTLGYNNATITYIRFVYAEGEV